MNKGIRISMLLVIIAQLFAPMLSASNGQLKSAKSSECFDYSFTADFTSVPSGTSVGFQFEYKATEPVCDPKDIEGEQISFDFTSLIAEGSDVDVDFDSEVFSVANEAGIVTLTFKDLSRTGETLVDFGGNVEFVVNVDDELDGDYIVSNSEGDELTINVIGTEPDNTNKISDIDYVQVGDTVTYQILINGQGNKVDNFTGIDVASEGLEYVDGSFHAYTDGSFVDVSENFTASINADGNLEVHNNYSFDQPVLLYYKMNVTSIEDQYSNEFTANYDTIVDSITDKLYYDLGSDSWQDYTHGNVEVTKVSEKGEKLSGAEFNVVDSSGNTIETITTDENGIATSQSLPLGNYSVVETKAPNGYILDSTPHQFEITGSDKGPQTVKVEVINIQEETEVTGQIDLEKVDEDGNPLANAEFTIYDVDGNEIEKLVTDENGYAISSELPAGDYVVIETKAPEGYVLNDKEYEVTIKKAGKVVSANCGRAIVNEKEDEPEVIVPEEKEMGQIDLQKVDEDGNPLANAEFTIYDNAANAVQTITTDQNGYAISDQVLVGDYVVIETKAPDGYVLSDATYKVAVSEDGQIAHVNDGKAIVNQKEDEPEVIVPEEKETGQIDLNKTDEDGNALAGAVFEISDSAGNVVDTVVTDEQGYAISGQLELGKYTVIETQAPTGYVLNHQKYNVQITKSGEVAHVNDGLAVVNKKDQKPEIVTPETEKTGQIDLNKTDENGNNLKGAEFTIYTNNGDKVESITTNKAGYAISSQLPLGDYVVIETKAPSGYEINQTKYKISITSDKQIAHVNGGDAIINKAKEDKVVGGGSEEEATNDDDSLTQTGSHLMTNAVIAVLILIPLLVVRRRIN